jgi:hypothetical protein
MTKKTSVALGAGILACSALLAACGGGGGGGSSTPPITGGPAPGSSGSPAPGGSGSPSPAPSSSPGATGALTTAAGPIAAGSTVTITCGCTGEAGETSTTDANGDFTFGSTLPAIPTSATPYQIVPGRNYLVVGYNSGSALQAWNMVFVGNVPSHDLMLYNGSNGVSSAAAAAASLYVYYWASTLQQNNTDQTFDLFNYNTVAAWAQHLSATSGLTANETAFLNDVAAAQNASQSMFPQTSGLPAWDPNPSMYGANAKLTADVQAIQKDGVALDPALPTPCPAANQCTGTPSP